MKKITCITTIVCFALVQSVGLSTAVEIDLRPNREVPTSLQIHIPEELATVDEVFEAPPSLDPRLIIHIQDAHGNYDAQVQIKRILEYLNKNYGFDLLFVEGAAGQMDPDKLNLFEDPVKNVEMTHYLAKKGQATGSDLYLMEYPNAMAGVGIEEVSLYRENYRAFVQVYSAASDRDAFIQQTETKLDLLSSRILSNTMRRLLSEWQKFSQGHREFLPYVKQLSREAKKILGLDLESIFAQVEWPQITRLLVMQSMEKDMNREAALQEKEKLLQFLSQSAVSKDLLKGIEQFESKGIRMIPMSGEPAQQPIMPRHLLERLLEEAGSQGFKFQDYPAFSLYAGYLILESELEPSELFGEIENLFVKILDELSVTQEEKDLLELFRDLELLKKTLQLELSRKDWSRAFYRKDWIRPDTLMKRIDTVDERVVADHLHQFPDSVATYDARLVSSMMGAYESAFRFYDYARKRESEFYYKIKHEMS